MAPQASRSHHTATCRVLSHLRRMVQLMGLDMRGLLDRLSAERPIFHSEADFQHALAWLIHSEHPNAQIRLETRPERGIRLDLLVVVGGERIAIELKYLVARFE